MVKLIGLCGKMRAGKDTVGEILKDCNERVIIMKFANPLYRVQNLIYKELELPPVDKDRKLLQYLGTDFAREKDPDMLIKLFLKDYYKTIDKFPNATIVVTDLRFDNEAIHIKSLGGKVVSVEAKDETRVSRGATHLEHASERGIDSSYIDASIYNDGSVADLRKNVEYLVEIFDASERSYAV